MKPVHIDFIENRRWRLVWAVAGMLVVGLMGGTVWQWEKMDQALREQSDRIAAAQLRLQQLRVVPTPINADPRRASIDQAAKFLQQDFNKAFATVENLQEKGVRLRSLSLEAGTNTLRLEYDLDAMAKASVVTAALNAGYENRPWRLESASGSTDGGQTGIVPGAPVFRGVWLVQINRL